MSVTVFFSEIFDVMDFCTSDMLQVVSKEKRQRLEKFRFSIDCHLSFYAEILLRRQAIERLSLRNSEIIFETNEYGKPYLKGYADFHFNISHTHNAIVIAISDSEIGVDVERIRPCDFKIAERFFTSRETVHIKNSSDTDKAFYEIWTKKESYIKYKGKGLSLPLKSFCVLDKEISDRIRTIAMKGYLISVCGDINALKEAIEIKELDCIFIKISESNEPCGGTK